jgi:hypothetical protein
MSSLKKFHSLWAFGVPLVFLVAWLHSLRIEAEPHLDHYSNFFLFFLFVVIAPVLVAKWAKKGQTFCTVKDFISLWTFGAPLVVLVALLHSLRIEAEPHLDHYSNLFLFLLFLAIAPILLATLAKKGQTFCAVGSFPE